MVSPATTNDIEVVPEAITVCETNTTSGIIGGVNITVIVRTLSEIDEDVELQVACKQREGRTQSSLELVAWHNLRGGKG